MHLKGTVSLVFLWPEPFTFLNSFFYYSNPSGHVFANVLKFDEVFASAKSSTVSESSLALSFITWSQVLMAPWSQTPMFEWHSGVQQLYM